MSHHHHMTTIAKLARASDDFPMRMYLSCIEIAALAGLMNEGDREQLVEALQSQAYGDDKVAMEAFVTAINSYKD